MSKMGVSTVASYTGAQIFEAVGLSQEVIDKYFTGTTSKLGGIGIEEIAREVKMRHDIAYQVSGIQAARREPNIGGEYQLKRPAIHEGGQTHLFDPGTDFRLQTSTREGTHDVFKNST